MSSDNRDPLLPDSRRNARVEVQITARLHSDWGECCDAKITNLSQSGLRLEGSSELLRLIMPNWCCLPGTDRLSTEVRFRVDTEVWANEEDAIVVRCRSVYVQRIDSDQFQIGMDYWSIDELSQRRLERFIKVLLIR